MSGHSKWATIKRRKGAIDANRAKIFTKHGREISVAVKEAGPDPVSNSKLREAINRAKSNNMPNDSILRSIKKAFDEDTNNNYEKIVYEGYGPEGVAIMVESLTDNKNRTAGDMRHYFDKYGGNLGQSGCVNFLFKRKGLILIDKNKNISEEKIINDIIECDADDLITFENYFEITTKPESLENICISLEKLGYDASQSEISYIPNSKIKFSEKDSFKKMDKLLEMLESNDDVQNFYHNLED
ncbi:MAG: YebC/PmpR family DNA-binding transcriptional regulator [Clostridiales bacterium]|jgi:YebC/PmpR family DNA-binding regulatory protein|nr:YebC/PmpR family DNA-binding transcriptional regulator [Clostridiales bacterium]